MQLELRDNDAFTARWFARPQLPPPSLLCVGDSRPLRRASSVGHQLKVLPLKTMLYYDEILVLCPRGAHNDG
jgi:hypothetical protein